MTLTSRGVWTAAIWLRWPHGGLWLLGRWKPSWLIGCQWVAISPMGKDHTGTVRDVLKNYKSETGVRDHFVNAPSQWETMLHCNVVSHWLGTYTKWSLGVHISHLLSYQFVVSNTVHCTTLISVCWMSCKFSYKNKILLSFIDITLYVILLGSDECIMKARYIIGFVERYIWYTLFESSDKSLFIERWKNSLWFYHMTLFSIHYHSKFFPNVWSYHFVS